MGGASAGIDAAAADPAIPHDGAYASHLVLLRKLDQAYEEQGILDPQTWIEVDKQILDCLEHGEMSVGQYIQLHGRIENRLRLAGGGWA